MEKLLAWVCLLLAFYMYHTVGWESNTGRFFNVMALVFFIVSIYKDIKIMYNKIRSDRD